MIFLSYAREDAAKVQALYGELRRAGLGPWMDKPPSPWQLDGIRPGEEWDVVIRTKIAEADVVLAFLSSASVAKRGYVQREYRLALDVASEIPAGLVFLIPVLLERCEVPDLRVGQNTLRQLQWFNLDESGTDTLVRYLEGLLLPGQEASVPPAESETSRSSLISIGTVLSSIDSYPGGPSPWDVFSSAVAALERGADDKIWQGWTYRLGTPKGGGVALPRATSALATIEDETVATAAAATVARFVPWQGNAPYPSEILSSLEQWLAHSVPQVRTLAALLLVRSGSASSEVQAELTSASSGLRLSDSLILQPVLREFALNGKTLAVLADIAPELLWILMANDPHFGGLGQRHRHLDLKADAAQLAQHPSWRVREVGVGLMSADETIDIEERLRFLFDREPRVRLRALEGVLQSIPSVETVIPAVVQAGSVEHEGRRWDARMVSESPQVLLATCADSAMDREANATGFFGNTHAGYDVHEFVDSRHGCISASVVLFRDPVVHGAWKDGLQIEQLELEERVQLAVARNATHWIHRSASDAGLQRVREVRPLYPTEGKATQQDDRPDRPSPGE